MTPVEIDEVVKNLRDNRTIKWRFGSTSTSWERAETWHGGYRYTVWGSGGLLMEYIPSSKIDWSFSVGEADMGKAFKELHDRLNEEAPKPDEVQSRLDAAANSLR